MNGLLIHAGKVDEAFCDCLYKDEELTGEVPKGTVIVHGVAHDYGFHPTRLEDKRSKVATWLSALPQEFHLSSGGGWSFLNACNQENGVQWTGLHLRMEQLFCLGIGLGFVRCLLPREIWGALPGGVPFYVIDVAAIQEA